MSAITCSYTNCERLSRVTLNSDHLCQEHFNIECEKTRVEVEASKREKEENPSVHDRAYAKSERSKLEFATKMWDLIVLHRQGETGIPEVQFNGHMLIAHRDGSVTISKMNLQTREAMRQANLTR